MKKHLQRISLTLVIIAGVALIVTMKQNGVIPKLSDTSDPKLCGINPTSGKVWSWTHGWGSGSAFYRMHLKRSSYAGERAIVLTEKNIPDLPHPWWWGTNPDGRATILVGGGLGQDTESYEIYDPTKELLYVYCEWD